MEDICFSVFVWENNLFGWNDTEKDIQKTEKEKWRERVIKKEAEVHQERKEGQTLKSWVEIIGEILQVIRRERKPKYTLSYKQTTTENIEGRTFEQKLPSAEYS